MTGQLTLAAASGWSRRQQGYRQELVPPQLVMLQVEQGRRRRNRIRARWRHQDVATDAATSSTNSSGQCGLLLFLHLEKTGGSTVVKMLEQYEKRGELLFFNQYCGWPQFASQLMERFRHELGLPYGRPRRRRLDGFMHSDSTMVAGGGNGRPAECTQAASRSLWPAMTPPSPAWPDTWREAWHISSAGRSILVATHELHAAHAGLATQSARRAVPRQGASHVFPGRGAAHAAPLA